MQYRLVITEAAIQQLRDLPKDLRKNIGFRIEGLCNDLQGDVKKLKGQGNRYRLRVGGYRVLFTLARDEIAVYAVKDRKAAYE